MALHGGKIEPGTSELAEAIAGSEYDFYAFEGWKMAGNGVLHITSVDFDEPGGIDIARNSEIVLTLHGYRGKDEIVFVGGLFDEMRERIREHLTHSGFRTAENMDFPGASPSNPCNRCRGGRGVQLELTRGLRSAMFQDKSLRDCTIPTELFRLFTESVRDVLSNYICRHSHISGPGDLE